MHIHTYTIVYANGDVDWIMGCDNVLTDSFIKWFRDFAACHGYFNENKILITSVGLVSSSSCVIIQFW